MPIAPSNAGNVSLNGQRGAFYQVALHGYLSETDFQKKLPPTVFFERIAQLPSVLVDFLVPKKLTSRMSQAGSNSNVRLEPIQLSLFVGEFDTSGDDWILDDDSLSQSLAEELKLSGVESSAPSTDSIGQLAVEFMQVFESISGWEVHFQESAASKRRRAQETCDRGGPTSTAQQMPQGKFEIIDMSIDWPAKTPTVHRGKCDQLIKLFSDLYSQADATQGNLDKVQGVLSALTNPVGDDDHLVDSFAPMLQAVQADQDLDFTLCQDSDDESAFVVKQEFSSSWLPEESVWTDWSIAGASGIVGESYLDWAQQGDELTVYVGRIESSLGVGDTESSLEVNAVSRQFKVCEDNTLAAFFFWDRRGGQLRSVEPGSWQTLYSQGAIVVSTDPAVQMPESVVNAQLGDVPFTAEQLATAIEAKLGADHRVLVIKCD